MFKSEETRLRAQTLIFKALAHPARLYIVEELSRGELCVCKITDQVGLDTSTISRHLTVLKNAGIIADNKRGQNVFYSLKMPCVLNFSACVQGVIKSKGKDKK